MNRILATLLLAAFLVPAVSAGPGHAGPVPYEQKLYVHMVDGDWVLHPSEPAGESLQAAHQGAPGCGNSFRWQAAFTQDVPSYDGGASASMTPGLARNASFDTPRPELVWYLEADNQAPAAINQAIMGTALVSGSLRTGSDVSAWGDGDIIATATEELTPTSIAAGDAQVYKFELKMTWQVEQELAPGTAMQLEVQVNFGPEQCRSDFPTLRAFSADGFRPHVVFWLFDPVRGDIFTVNSDNGTVVVDLTIRSPWGTAAIGNPNDAIISGPAGEVAGVQRTIDRATEDALILQWSWVQGSAPNATYRVDIAFADFNGDGVITDFLIFDVKGPEPVDDGGADPAPKKDSPGVGFVALLGAILAVGLALRRR